MATIHWDIQRWDTEFAFSNLGDYLELIEGQFEILREKEQKKIPQNPPAGLTEEELAEWQADIIIFERRYFHDFPSIIRYSFVVQLHILLETRLKAICDEISKRKGLGLKESDFKGSPIERVCVFLEKVMKLPVKEHSTWEWLKNLQKVRDCIVHSNGNIELSRDKKYLIDLCRNKRIGLSVESGTLMIDRDYCDESLKMINSFFQELFETAGFGSSTPTVDI
jgi:hypothetical protein